MSLLVVGLSHRTADLDLLETVAVPGEEVPSLLADLMAHPSVAEAAVVATCNRLEVYVQTVSFHPAATAVGRTLAQRSGVPFAALREHLFVHHDERAVAHVFTLAAGLDSMAVGETQILGQLRTALRVGRAARTVGPALSALLQQALRVGKRVHTETGLDAVSRSLVEAGLESAGEALGRMPGADAPALRGRRVLVIGAGGMSALAAGYAAAHGPAHLTIVNRTLAKARRLAAELGAHAAPMSELSDELARAQVVVSSTGATGHVVTPELLAAADRIDAPASPGDGCATRVFVDLALPRDVDPLVGQRPGQRIVDLATIGSRLAGGGDPRDVPALAAARELIAAEVAAHLAHISARSVAPTVTALRSRAAAVVAAELERFDHKQPGADAATRAEVERTVHRVVEKLLHAPTARVKQGAASGQGPAYAAALAELFDLARPTAEAPTGVDRDTAGTEADATDADRLEADSVEMDGLEADSVEMGPDAERLEASRRDARALFDTDGTSPVVGDDPWSTPVELWQVRS